MSGRTRKLLALVCVLVGIAALAVAARLPVPMVGIMAAAVMLFFASTLISRPQRLAAEFHPYVGRNVKVSVWGMPLDQPETTFRVDEVRALGAGLHFYLTPAAGRRAHLKVAQPTGDSLTPEAAHIAQAKYVEWESRKIKKLATAEKSAPALVLTVV